MLNQNITVEQLNKMSQQTLVSHLGIEFVEIGQDFVKAKMAVDARTCQPYGLLHGGASAALAETLGSIGSACFLDFSRQMPVGLEINANHIRSAKKGGTIYGTATPLHLGRRTHVWDIKIVDENKRLICTSRLTIMVVDQELS